MCVFHVPAEIQGWHTFYTWQLKVATHGSSALTSYPIGKGKGALEVFLYLS